jgi:hypothetical protein
LSAVDGDMTYTLQPFERYDAMSAAPVVCLSEAAKRLFTDFSLPFAHTLNPITDYRTPLRIIFTECIKRRVL